MDQDWISSSGWLVLALVNAGLAEQKDRSRWTWFLLSLPLGPIATFFIVTWERAPRPHVADRIAAEEGPTRGLLALGIGLVALSAVCAVIVLVGGDPGLGILAVALLVAGASSLVLHVLAHRRWRAMEAAARR